MNNWRPLFELAQSAIENRDEYLLATVVRLDGSGYGRPGARMLLSRNGERAGYISGGCLEKDLCRRAWDVTKNGPELMAFDTRGNSINPGRYNTGCDGVVCVLCQRFRETIAPDLIALKRAGEDGQTVKFATVYRSESSSFRVGQSVIQVAHGPVEWDHSRGADPVDDFATRKLCRLVEESQQTKSVIFSDEEGATIELFVESIEPPIELLIFGAGDDALPVHDIAARLGWRLTIVGRRPELADPARFPQAKVLCGPAETVAQTLAISDNTYVVLMSHDFDQDLRLLPALLDSPAKHIGILGPKRRLGKMAWHLAQRGRPIRDDEVERIHSPVGLDIGATTPEEIAISLISEMIARVRNRDGGFLHDRGRPLNSPHVIENRIAFEPGTTIEIGRPREFADREGRS